MGGVGARFAEIAAGSCANETETNSKAVRQNAEVKRLILMRNVLPEEGAGEYRITKHATVVRSHGSVFISCGTDGFTMLAKFL